jgi:hypothetical protein
MKASILASGNTNINRQSIGSNSNAKTRNNNGMSGNSSIPYNN